MLEIFRVVIKLDNQKLPTITAKKKSTAIQIKKKKNKNIYTYKKEYVSTFIYRVFKGTCL